MKRLPETRPGDDRGEDTHLPLPPSHDPDWRERIERARNAREEGRRAREGMPIVFPIDRPQSLA